MERWRVGHFLLVRVPLLIDWNVLLICLALSRQAKEREAEEPDWLAIGAVFICV